MLSVRKKKLSITLDEELIKALKVLADENDRSVSGYINVIIKAHVKQKQMLETK